MISISRDVTNKQPHAHSCHLRLTGALHHISAVATQVCALRCKFKFYQSDLTQRGTALTPQKDGPRLC